MVAALLAGFDNPVVHVFDPELYDRGILEVRHKLPYSDAESLSDEEKGRWAEKGHALEFGHTLEEQIGGQIEAGFVVVGFYEDRYPDEAGDTLSEYAVALGPVSPFLRLYCNSEFYATS